MSDQIPRVNNSSIVHRAPPQEGWFDEGCFITEWLNDPSEAAVSIARARVLPGHTTLWHRLEHTAERYVIVAGEGLVQVQGLAPASVGPGSIVHIAPGAAQRISNQGLEDLIFLAVCTPRFELDCYHRVNEPSGS